MLKRTHLCTGFTRRALMSSTVLVCGALATPALAQPGQTSATQIEEIIVTARKREETLLNVPAAVTAIPSAELKRVNAADLTVLNSLVPDLVIGTAPSGNGGSIALRGLASSGSDAGLESEVLIDVDGVPISRGWITRGAFLDLQQVQVLKGPQALFYGMNSPGGVVSLVSKDPTRTFEASVDAGYEFNARERYVEAAISGPVSDTVSARLAFRYDALDGWLTNTAGPIANDPLQDNLPAPGATTNKRVPNGQTIEGRVTVDWTPNDRFSAQLKVLLDNFTNSSGATDQAQIIHCANGVHQQVDGVPDPYGTCSVGTQVQIGAIPTALAQSWSRMDSANPYLINNNYVTSLKLNYKAGDIDFTSITGFYSLYENGEGNYDDSSLIAIPSMVGEGLSEYTEEVRAQSSFNFPLNFVAGLFYMHEDQEDWNIARISVSSAPFIQIVTDPTTGLNEEYNSDNFQTVNSVAPYFQAIWKIRPNLELDVGARYTYEQKTAALGNQMVNLGVADPAVFPLPESALLALRPAGDYLHGKFSDGNWSPDVTVTWHPTPAQTLYAAYRTGYKSGGFSITGVVNTFSTIGSFTYGSEQSHGFEGGYKAELLDRRLALSIDGYRYTYDNLQVDSLNLTTVSFLVQNAASAVIQGVEGQVHFQVTPDLQLYDDTVYNSAVYASYPNAQCFSTQTVAQGCVGGSQSLTGHRFAGAPLWDSHTGFNFTHDLWDGWSLGADGEIEYNSGYALSNNLVAPGGITRQGEYYRINADIRVFQPKGHWTFGLVGRDLNNAIVLLSGGQAILGAPGDEDGEIARPLQISLQASYRY